MDGTVGTAVPNHAGAAAAHVRQQGREEEDEDGDDEDGQQGEPNAQIRLGERQVRAGIAQRQNALEAPLIHVPSVCRYWAHLLRMLDESLTDGRKTFSSVTCCGYTSG